MSQLQMRGLFQQPLEPFRLCLKIRDSQAAVNLFQDGCWIRRPASMPKPYSNDLRTRVVLAVRSGETCRSVAKRFGVSVPSVVKWSQRYRVTGSVSPDKMGGYRRPLLDPHRDFIIEQIERTPHLTLYQRRELSTFVGPLSRSDGHDCFGLVHELVPGLAPGLNDGVVIFEDAVREPVLSEVLPDVLDRV